MTGIDHAKMGLCGICEKPTGHGPWTDEQIAEVVADTGVDAAEFEDWCDDCFVENVTMGDAAYAAKLLGRPMKLRKPENAFKALLRMR